jgi:hypothetical protein
MAQMNCVQLLSLASHSHYRGFKENCFTSKIISNSYWRSSSGSMGTSNSPLKASNLELVRTTASLLVLVGNSWEFLKAESFMKD